MPVNKDFYTLAGSSGQSTGYEIDQSIRFNDDDSPALKKTYSGAGTEETFTFSCWVKRGNTGASLGGSGNYGLCLFSGGSSVNNYGEIRFESSGYGTQDSLFFYNSQGGSVNMQLATNRVFRDPSAWYHIICVMDTTNSVSSERMRMYVNGERETSFNAETYPAKDTVPHFNTATEHGVGVFAVSTDTRHFDGYLAEIHFLDGYAYGPEYFGEFDSSDNWIPKKYSGSYGTNGFKIDGRDSSDLGDDESGNGNDYTASGLAANDQVSDSPTNNFATLNSIYADVSGINSLTLANGNLQGTGTSGQFDHKTATFNLPQSGKWYFEYYLGGLYTGFGLCIVGQEGSITGGYGLGNLSTSQGFGYQNNSIYNGSGQTTDFGLGNRSAGDIMSAAIDVDNDKVYIGINNTYIAADGGNDGNPSSGANPTVTTSFSLSTNDIILGFYLSSSSSAVYLNFGQEGTFAGNKTAGGNSDANGIGNFLYSVPTNYLAICSKNLFSSGG